MTCRMIDDNRIRQQASLLNLHASSNLLYKYCSVSDMDLSAASHGKECEQKKADNIKHMSDQKQKICLKFVAKMIFLTPCLMHLHLTAVPLLCTVSCKRFVMLRAQVLGMLAQSSEFSQVAVREEELPELDELARNACPYDVKGGVENSQGKVSILLQVLRLAFSARLPLSICAFFCVSLHGSFK